MKIDFHTHTCYSDGKETPENLVKYAEKRGIFLAITDHDNSNGIRKVLGKVIPGQEVTTQYGHVVILCNFIPSPPKDIDELIDYARENSCIVFPSHPFDIFRKGIGNHLFDYKFTAIEIFNSKAPKSANKKAEDASKKLNLPGLSNSDSHVKEAIGSAYNEFEIDEFKIDEIFDLLISKKFKPVRVGLTKMAKLKIIEWHIQRKLFEKNTRRTMYSMQR